MEEIIKKIESGNTFDITLQTGGIMSHMTFDNATIFKYENGNKINLIDDCGSITFSTEPNSVGKIGENDYAVVYCCCELEISFDVS